MIEHSLAENGRIVVTQHEPCDALLMLSALINCGDCHVDARNRFSVTLRCSEMSVSHVFTGQPDEIAMLKTFLFAFITGNGIEHVLGDTYIFSHPQPHMTDKVIRPCIREALICGVSGCDIYEACDLSINLTLSELRAAIEMLRDYPDHTFVEMLDVLGVRTRAA